MESKVKKPKEQKQDNIIYCSLDIETSGFDPLVNEILEVGYAFFKYEKNKIVVVKKFTQVFKPSKPVVPQILGLTGISQQELDDAPTFESFKESIQKDLGDAIIVGHNIAFDTKFLEGFGIKFNGKLIDTLDLVQWLLPTHHSYNLENLMHTFSIAHKDAHRALADALATIYLLEKLLTIFNSLEIELQQEIIKLVEKSNIPWVDLLFWKFKAETKKDKDKEKGNIKKQKTGLELEAQTIYNFSIDKDYSQILQYISGLDKVKTLLVVPKVQNALALCKQGLSQGILVSPEYNFNKDAFKKLKAKPSLSSEEVRFILKVLVWQKTNWQTDTILDLNLSFFGGQFRELITGEAQVRKLTEKIIVCDHATFLKLAEHEELKKRRVVIFGLNEFENAITSNIGVRASWGYITYIVKSFYNSELNTGNAKFKEPVESALLSIDLFFGLINALLQTEPASFQYYKINNEILNSEAYLKIHAASESFVAKLEELNKSLESESINNFIISIKSFFEVESNKVKWIELAENRCTLMSMPIQISELVTKYTKAFKQVIFIDTLGSDILVKFFVSRLGLSGFRTVNITEPDVNTGVEKLPQRDLFSGLKQVFSIKQVVNFHFSPKNATQEDYLALLNSEKTIQTALLMPNPSQVKEFYEANYQTLKQKTALLVQSHTGGSNKLLRNFTINPNSLLLATDKFILKALSSNSQVEQVESLPVKTLVISRLPFEQFSHPYQEAVSNSFSNSFVEFSLPRALYNLLSIIKFFYTPKLKDIYIYDAKLAKDYAKVFLDVYNSVPNAKKIL